MIKNRILTAGNLKGRKGGWYVSYETSFMERICEVFKTKAQAMKAAKAVHDYQNLAGVYSFWPLVKGETLKTVIGERCTIIDQRGL